MGSVGRKLRQRKLSLFFRESNFSPALSFKKARTIAPLYTGGPVAITQNGLWLVTCVGEQALLTDLQSGAGICRFSGVLYPIPEHLLLSTFLITL
jgi:U3 small nucleolar RNA-associated protein 13